MTGFKNPALKQLTDQQVRFAPPARCLEQRTRAQKLLAEAGFTRKNNALFGPDGKQFTFEFMYPSTSDTSKRVATFVVDAMAQAGIVVRPAPTEWTVLLQRQKERDLDALFAGWGGGAVEDDPQQIFSSSAIAGAGSGPCSSWSTATCAARWLTPYRGLPRASA